LRQHIVILAVVETYYHEMAQEGTAKKLIVID
jgi:hypothetical protein